MTSNSSMILSDYDDLRSTGFLDYVHSVIFQILEKATWRELPDSALKRVRDIYSVGSVRKN
jgi:hypothetical protein